MKLKGRCRAGPGGGMPNQCEGWRPIARDLGEVPTRSQSTLSRWKRAGKELKRAESISINRGFI